VTAAAVLVRPGGPEDHEAIRGLVEAVYGVPRSPESFHWLYAANPAGPAELWVAEDPATGRIVGCRPLFPWRVRAGGRVLAVRQAGDAMTHPDFRGRGIFSALVVRAWTHLRDQGIPFAFSFSQPGSLSVYRKTSVGEGTGTRETLHFRRLAYPLSLPVLGGATRALQRRRLRLTGDLSVFEVHRFGEEFDALADASTAGPGTVATVRDARYLNWRFIDAPGGPFEVVGVRRRGALAGAVAFEVDAGGRGFIVDLVAPPAPDSVDALLRATLLAMLERGCRRVSIWAAEETRAYHWVRRFGFVPREGPFPMAVHVYHPGPDAQAALDGARWWAWYGDRDVERAASEPREALVAGG
jgi:GNAT superfamily N-acetyltransferase